jgi:hypothetical protein
MRPFFLIYGGKWRSAANYGPPQHEHVTEPFAGSGGFSCYWQPRRVTLVEKDPTIVGIWKYLQRTTPREIMRLPTEVSSVEEIPQSVCGEARNLIAMWFNRVSTRPNRSRSNWARSAEYGRAFWGQGIRKRIASQVELIRHWKIREGSWESAPNVKAHWFIDAPYTVAGSSYVHNHIDRTALAAWCKTRRGHVTVCEAKGATWLPFEPLHLARTPRGYSAEAIFEKT